LQLRPFFLIRTAGAQDKQQRPSHTLAFFEGLEPFQGGWDHQTAWKRCTKQLADIMPPDM
jgi:hypothetical protein